MENLILVITMLCILFIAIRAISFGVWTWKKDNKLGACMVFLVALSSIALPVFEIFILDNILD